MCRNERRKASLSRDAIKSVEIPHRIVKPDKKNVEKKLKYIKKKCTQGFGGLTLVCRWRSDPVRRRVPPPRAMASFSRMERPSDAQRRDSSTSSATGCT